MLSTLAYIHLVKFLFCAFKVPRRLPLLSLLHANSCLGLLFLSTIRQEAHLPHESASQTPHGLTQALCP